MDALDAQVEAALAELPEVRAVLWMSALSALKRRSRSLCWLPAFPMPRWYAPETDILVSLPP